MGCLFAALCMVAVVSGYELINNGNFESSSSHGWSCSGCTVRVVSSSAHNGHSALKVTARSGANRGPSQIVHMTPGQRYRVQAYVKQVNDVTGTLFQAYQLKIQYTYDDHETESIKVVYHKSVRSVDGWFSMIGYFVSPERAATSSQLQLLGPDPAIKFLLDDVSLTEVAEDTHWEAEANNRIENIRKGDIHIRVNLPASIQPDEINVQIDHKKHSFGFGALANDVVILEHQYKGLQNIFYSLFNIATLQSFKWRFDKGTMNHPNYTQAVAAMHTLKSHGLAVRGHNLFWGFTKNLPDWLPHLPLSQINATVQDHLHYMVNITRGQLLHWDIMNELLHGQWFEEKFNDPDFSQRIFTQVKALDPQPTLMLNDFSVMAKGGDSTDAYLQQAKRFLAAGTPLGALGMQSHFKYYMGDDPTLLKLRLDHLAQSGLPLWVTEMTVMEQDPTLRADRYEKAYRLYFSHPSVHGIVLWSIWDQQNLGPQAALVDGFDFTMNEAGRRVAKLIKEEWSTHVNKTLTSNHPVVIRGFKGDYDVTVRRNGVPVKLTTFSLTGDDVRVHIDLSGNEAPVTIPTTPQIASGTTPTPSTVGAHVVGHARSSSSSSTLQCTSRLFDHSHRGDGERAQVTCHSDEVMTGCSSYLRHDWRRDGERIEMQGGQATCVAVNGFHSTSGVKASAVCCKAKGLNCTYRTAGPSPAGQNKAAEAVCSNHYLALGCSAYKTQTGVGGATSSGSSCLAYNQDSQTGVYVYAACCRAPNLSCVTISSLPSGQHLGDAAHVTCEDGYVMTGCNAMSNNGKASGAYIASTENRCRAVNGADAGLHEQGVRAVATCCKLS